MTKIIYPEAVVVSLPPGILTLWGEEAAERLTERVRDALTEDGCPGGEGYCSARCRRLCGLAR